MTNEIDLVKQALVAEPLDRQARDRARAQFLAYRETARDTSPGRFRKVLAGRRHGQGVVGIGAGIGALAAGAAVVFAVTTTLPAENQRTPVVPSADPAPVIESELVALTNRIADEKPGGDASLIIESRTTGGSSEQVTYNLYADDGRYFFAEDRASLAAAVDQGRDVSASSDHRKAQAAAIFAADGDLTVARTKMVNAEPNYLGLGLGQAERQKLWNKALANSADVMAELGIEPDPNPPVGKELEMRVGSALWNNSYEALATGAGDPKVRAGVLRLLSTIPDVSVEKSTSEGVLKLTAAAELSGGDVVQELTIDADNGTPLSYESKPVEPGIEASKSTLEVSRVTVAEVQAD
ncbi:hypothetical protein Kisp01_28270 [Kineosporia sp. NBRC 101677]|uniref:hypothetical protein n=1 Tax=Kineosporia sp. NBRC 101677 TaxID=3032197 RepID=UPI0024A4616A|nr:hypothetical protein [Kineosporia sp. NBRC 101677]GLY15812.1 hypothetical protein Kisp01_28270 [Kineosporia sp. NBRC 101677]